MTSSRLPCGTAPRLLHRPVAAGRIQGRGLALAGGARAALRGAPAGLSVGCQVARPTASARPSMLSV